MPFKKASPKQAFVKVGMYGPEGSGKTFTALLMAEGLAKVRGGRIAFIDTERGTDFYAQTVKERKIHPEAFDFDAIYTRSLAEASKEIAALDPDVHRILIIDSVTHLYDAAIEAYDGKRTSRGDLPIYAWPILKRPYKRLIRQVLDLPIDVFILGRQKNVWEEIDGKLKLTGTAMRTENDTPYEVHVNFQLTENKGGHYMRAEKDRTGIFDDVTMQNPAFKDFEPILQYLGLEQAVMDNEDDRIAADSDLLNELSDEKMIKSEKLYNQFKKAIEDSASLAALREVQATVKKKKGYMLEEHVEVLRERHATRLKELSV